jgi:hypothetical protein
MLMWGMKRTHALGLAGFTWAMLAIIGVAPGTARAMTCSTNLLPDGPVGGQANVPTDTLLWGYSLGNTRLLGPSGEVISMTERALVVAGSFSAPRVAVPVLVPGSDLQPNMRYTIEVDPGDGAPPALVEFVTGAGPAGSAPAQPSLLSSASHVGRYWPSAGPARWTQLQFQKDDTAFILIGMPGDSQAGEGPAIAGVEDLLIDGPPSEQAIAEAPRVQWASDGDLVEVGFNDCVLWPDGAPDNVNARFAVLDLAGNFSEWTDVPLEIPPEAEAQAAADAQDAASAREAAEQAAEDARVSAANLAMLAAIDSRDRSCAIAPTPARGSSPLAALSVALGLVLVSARRALRKAGASARAR